MNPKTNGPPPSARIRELVHRSLDELLTPSEVREIEAALESSGAIRAWYVDVIQLHAELADSGEARETCKRLLEEFHDDQCSVESPFEALPMSRRGWRRFSPISIAASLLIVGLGLGCGMGLLAATIIHVRPSFSPLPWSWKVDNDVVARIASTDNVMWQPSEAPETLPTLGVRSGQQIRITKGHLQLAFRSGVSAILAGPAVFEVRSETGGKLYSGQLSATAPTNSSTFHVDTPGGRFQFGPGHYGVEVINRADGNTSSLHAIAGIASGAASAHFVSTSGVEFDIHEGQAIEFDSFGTSTILPLAATDRFPSEMPPARRELFTEPIIHLGNLFDDSKSATLSEAMLTDTYQAAGETIDLGVAAVHDGGLDVDVRLAEDGLVFNFSNVGGGGSTVIGLPANDTYRSTSTIPIRTTGKDFRSAGPLSKVEEGIGMCTNELITFDLEELRQAGQLEDLPMQFVADYAGINDREDPLQASRTMASAHLVAIVSTRDEVFSAYVNGRRLKVVERGGVHTFDLTNGKLSPPLRYNGEFVAFHVPIPADARYLTLATTMLDEEHHDHTVFSGARLEIKRDE